MITYEILNRRYVPYYGTASSNIASQRVAHVRAIILHGCVRIRASKDTPHVIMVKKRLLRLGRSCYLLIF